MSLNHEKVVLQRGRHDFEICKKFTPEVSDDCKIKGGLHHGGGLERK